MILYLLRLRVVRDLRDLAHWFTPSAQANRRERDRMRRLLGYRSTYRAGRKTIRL